jgi:hypothetical protein
MGKWSIIKRLSFSEFLKLPEGEREMITGVWMGEAIRNEAFRYSQRLANQKAVRGLWEHALIERDSRKESWIMFEPGNERARNFHSFMYWETAWEKGETILCSGTSMGWNTLTSTDRVIISVKMDRLKYMSEWDFACEVKKISVEYGI